jgi:hypothetical protein
MNAQTYDTTYDYASLLIDLKAAQTLILLADERCDTADAEGLRRALSILLDSLVDKINAGIQGGAIHDTDKLFPKPEEAQS